MGKHWTNNKINTELFDKFLRLLDLYLDMNIHKEHVESSFTEEEWEHLYEWQLVLMALMREHDGLIDKMLEEYERKVKKDPRFKKDLERVLHLKKILDKNPLRLFRFGGMVSYLEEKWHEKIMEKI